MFQSFGKLRYSPKLIGSRVSEKWWLIIDADPEIGQYYRHLFWLFRHKAEEIQRASWAEHITVIRNEEPPIKTNWEKYAGQTIDFSVLPNVQTDGQYFWFPVVCPQLYDIREELGLPREPSIPLHLSIGHI